TGFPPARDEARRGLQPCSPVLCSDELEPARPNRRVHGPRRDENARGDPAHLSRDALLSSILVGDVWKGQGDPPDRGNPVLSTLALRGCEGVRAPHHGQLPRVVRALRGERDPLQSRVTAPRAGVRDAEGDGRSCEDQARTPEETLDG